MSYPRPIELLAPARCADTAIEAIKHGADAVYIGSVSHGARSAAANTLADIERVVQYAHPYGVRVYVTLNTIIYSDELRAVERMIHELYRIGVDALIVQDMGLLRMELPPIALHASTQCDIATPDKARFLRDAGFSQLVLARELTLSETAAIHSAVPDVALEAFIHGALCVSYSGNCHAGTAVAGRSANRGECPQLCRLPYDLVDATGRVIMRGKHLLSLRDLNRSAVIADMLEAGISSFKIEGRLKDAAYVKNVTAAYRKIIDGIISENPERYCRSSFGSSRISFTPDLNESFNRGYTEYFTRHERPDATMASLLSPKWCGTPVGKVTHCAKGYIKAELTTELNNGDGLGFFDPATGQFKGFRLNRVSGRTLYPATPQSIPPGTVLYRNFNKNLSGIMDGDTASRTIDVTFKLHTAPGSIVLDATDERGCSVSVAESIAIEPAATPQETRRHDILTKTGTTIYRVTCVTDSAGAVFIPAKQLTALRRRTLEALDSAWRSIYTYEYRCDEKNDAPLWDGLHTLTYHNNVANHAAKAFYRSHGAQSIEPAMEINKTPSSPIRIMTTRYCLRRELGACLRNPAQASSLPKDLYLVNGKLKLHLTFDCSKCGMMIDLIKNT
ncbi:MAG: U32 family peptidase [Muribaculaceae bacterium]|nr:U32 family peptidase [Muribaculaceae bacterium]